MHLLYTLIASGLLILSEIPAEQPPPTVPYYAQVYSGSPSTYQGVPGYATRNKSNEDNYEVRHSPSVRDDRLESGANLLPVDYKISPAPAATANATNATYGQPSALPITGYATYYNPNIMQQVLNYRLSLGQVSTCNECVGTVALLQAGDINRRIWLQWADGSVEGPFLVIDVAASQHVKMLLARHWVVDVDNRTAVRHGMLGPVLVTVWGSPPEPSEVASLPLLQLSYSSLATERNDAQAQLPVETPQPSATPPARVASAGNAAVIHYGFPTETTVPTITPLPPINNAPSPTPTMAPPPTVANTPTNTPVPSPPVTPVLATEIPTPVMVTVVIPTPVMVTVVVGEVPLSTAAPTITPLPPINTSPSPSATSVQVVPTVVPTNTPLPTSTLPPTATALPVLKSSTPANKDVVGGGFPTETVVPTITPLPPISLTPYAGTATATIPPTPAPVQSVAPTPTYTPTPATSPVVSATIPVAHGGFPTETPVPTITPLPAIDPQSTPAP